MATQKLSKKQKRKLKKKEEARINSKVAQIVAKNKKTETEVSTVNVDPHDRIRQSVEGEPYVFPVGVVNYIADRNGCGYFRCIWPFELLSTYKNLISMNSYAHLYEPSYLKTTQIIRFQRQATLPQRHAWEMYRQLRNRYNFEYKLQYEIDDYLMGIEESNTIAYQYFDAQKKENHMYMLQTSDRITFSTERLKDVYVERHGIDPNQISVIRNTLPQFLYNLPPRTRPNDFNSRYKPRILWSGSASHVGKGGDLEFLIPMIKATVNEYTWVFQGVIPEELIPYVKERKIEFIPWSPTYGLANIQFYVAKPDICIAPLKPSLFNSCKSDLKLLECNALGAPCITTSFLSTEHGKSPYEDTAEICLDPDPDVWKSAIDHLISEPTFYMDVVRKGYNHINSRWMENHLDAWLNGIDYKVQEH